MALRPQSPDSSWSESFFRPGLLTSKNYLLDTLKPEDIKAKSQVKIRKLDQNESCYDWPEGLKEKVTEKLRSQSWNSYPSPYALELEELIAEYSGIEKGHVLVASGGSQIISLALTHLLPAPNASWVILRPSFVRYEEIARTQELGMQLWPLGAQYEFTPTTLPPLQDGSVVIFATPNNPTGTVLPSPMLRSMLQDHPRVLFICDEAYVEFAEASHLNLLQNHANLMIIRTFSKSFGAAGMRCGYLLAAKAFITQLRKALRPFSLNHFSLMALREMLSHSETLALMQNYTQMICKQRDELYSNISALAQQHQGFFVPPSQANFLLLTWHDHAECMRTYEELKKRGILTRNLSGAPGLKSALRLSIGKPEDNAAVLTALSEILQRA